ncbi:MAG: NAD(P)-dependent oxidoreductase, partial [Pseudomonadales bacterium]|nr:NAD(P)-dependent oxidoreductase [Pseudomonadales bacterium]
MSVTPVDLSQKKILVTGPTSQVAYPLVEELVKHSSEIYGLARFSNNRDEQRILDMGAKTIKKDLASDKLDDLPDDFDYILHFAVVKTGNFDYDMKANAIGAGRLLAHCKNTRAFLLCSSGGVYQYAGQEPLKEDAPLGDNHRSLMPTYSICKIAQETVVKFAGEQFGVPTVTGRLSMPYGNNGGWPFYHLLMIKQGIPIDIHPEQPNRYSP